MSYLYQDCSYVSSGSVILSSSCQMNPMAFGTYSGSTQFNTIAIIRPDGTIGLNKDIKVHQDFIMYVIVFPIVGIVTFFLLLRWMFK